MTKLYEIYKAGCGAIDKTPFSIYKFTEHFKDHNLSLFKRKEDRCNVCIGYDEGNVEHDIYIFNYHQ